VGWRGRDKARRGVERYFVSVRGGEEKEIEGGWTLTGWRESDIDCEGKGGDRGKAI